VPSAHRRGFGGNQPTQFSVVVCNPRHAQGASHHECREANSVQFFRQAHGVELIEKDPNHGRPSDFFLLFILSSTLAQFL
jgi:hypothetical protein